jgi:GntR family transcriptional repressor for pyruvate dehydrogenase complex
MANKKVLSAPVKKQTLAEKMAETIKDLILSDHLENGEVLPTEPELAEQFGVSRAVVRDATRILMAKGLVEVQHGRGVFVTEPNNQAFGDALLLALQRAKATVWDVEQFEQILFPEIFALAAEFATEDEIKELEILGTRYMDFVESYHKKWWGQEIPEQASQELVSHFRSFLQKLFSATHNKLIEQLALPLLQLRNFRQWEEDDQMTAEDFIRSEKAYVDYMINLVNNRKPEEARELARKAMSLLPGAIESMKKTAVGEVPVINTTITKQMKEHLDQIYKDN